MGRVHDLPELLELIYDAALDQRRWPRFLEAVARETDSEIAGVCLFDSAGPQNDLYWQFGLPFEGEAEYARWAEHNEFARAALPIARAGSIIHSQLSHSAIRRSVFNNEFLGRYYSLLDYGGVTVRRDSSAFAYLVTHRSAKKPDYDSDYVDFFRPLVSHLERAFSMHLALAEANLRTKASLEALDRVKTAVFLLAESKRVLFFNDAASRLLDRCDGLKLGRSGELDSDDPVARPVLAKAIGGACSAARGDTANAGGALRIARTTSTKPYSVVVSPLPVSAAAFLRERPAAVVLAGDPEQESTPADVLRAIFELTPAESRLAEALGDGLTLEDVADSMGITRNTARWTLRQVFQKTGTNRQSELVRIVAAVPKLRSGSRR